MDEPFVGHSVNRILMPATLEEARRTELAFQKTKSTRDVKAIETGKRLCGGRGELLLLLHCLTIVVTSFSARFHQIRRLLLTPWNITLHGGKSADGGIRTWSSISKERKDKER